MGWCLHSDWRMAAFVISVSSPLLSLPSSPWPFLLYVILFYVLVLVVDSGLGFGSYDDTIPGPGTVGLDSRELILLFILREEAMGEMEVYN